MALKLRRCKKCSTIGRVNRSKPRGFYEKGVMRLFPLIGIYRCHNCNWRGWMRRSKATTVSIALLLSFYVLLVAGTLTAGTFYALKKIDEQKHFKYGPGARGRAPSTPDPSKK